METEGKLSTGRSSGEPLHPAAAIIETLGRITGGSDENSLPCSDETAHRLVSDIMSKFEGKVGDVASVLEAEEARKEAAAALSFGFKLQLCSEQMDELRREMCRLLRSFSPENKDVKRTMIAFCSEPYVRRIAKLQWIAERISTLRWMDPDLDSKVKSDIVQLKSESFLSAMEEVEEECSGEGVAGEGRRGQEVSMEMEEKRFAAYRVYWERLWGIHNSFEDQTLMSSMLFTHCTPRHRPAEAVAGSTLQIYSIKVSAIKGLEWPLEVYGVVAARDAADRRRNPIFLRRRHSCQIVAEQDPFLRLTGPVRAIVSMDTVYMEIQLRVKGATESEDRALISTFYFYNGDTFHTHLVDNEFCTLELCYEQLERSVQATILSVVLTPKPGSLPFPHGGRVVCTSLPPDDNEEIAGLPSRQVLLVDSEGGRIPMARNGHLELLRSVVSVELEGKLQVVIMAYSASQSADIAARSLFTPKKCNISREACYLDDGSMVEIIVAWSLIPSKMRS